MAYLISCYTEQEFFCAGTEIYHQDVSHGKYLGNEVKDKK